MNVNHTVDSAEPDDGSEEAPEMKSKPNFEVDIVKTGGKTLSFSCSFAPPQDLQDPQAQSEEGYGKIIGDFPISDNLVPRNLIPYND